MKKLLLIVALLCATFAASAEIVVDKFQEFKGLEKFPFYAMGYEPKIVDGILVAESPGEWFQFFVADGISFDPACEYTVTVKMKGSEAGSLEVSLGNWDATVDNQLSFTTEWSEESVVFNGLTAYEGFCVFRPGSYSGTLEIEWIKISREVEAGKDVLIKYQNYSDTKKFPYYVMGFEPEMIDGKMVITNEEAKGFWEVQYFVCNGFPIEEGVEYTVSANIKSNVEGRIVTVMGSFASSKGGDMKIEANNEWTVYSCAMNEVPVPDDKQSMLIFQSGDVVGTYEIEWVKVTRPAKSDDSSGVDNIVISANDNNRTVVYNLMGVKVLDTDNASLLSTLPKGLYIVNGKKVIL